MKKAIFLVGLLLVVSLLAKPSIANAQEFDMSAMEVSQYNSSPFPPSVTSMQATTVQNGSINWYSIISNDGQTPVTNATVSVMSGYNSSLFDSVSAFPFVNSFSSLAAGEGQVTGKLNPSSSENIIPVNYTLGHNSTKTITPTMIPAGGTQQTVTVTVTLTDSRYTSSGMDAFHVFFNSNVTGVTLVSTTNPANLDQGEQIQTWSDEGAPTLFHWMLSGDMQLNKTYTFKAILNVPNTYGVPYEFQPEIKIDADSQTPTCWGCAGLSTTITDPTLDGNVPGSGAVTFSVAETDRIWFSKHSNMYSLTYGGTEQPVFNPPTSKDQCKKGGWKTFTFPSFKNQGDCVSYVATHGKNPPNGN